MPESRDSLRLPPDVVKKLGIQTGPVEKATRPRVMQLSGTLALDTDHMSRVHSLFGGEVVEIAKVEGARPKTKYTPAKIR